MDSLLFKESIKEHLEYGTFTLEALCELSQNLHEYFKVGNLRRGSVLPRGYSPLYFGRPTIYQNPIRLLSEKDRLMVLVKYEEYLLKRLGEDQDFINAVVELMLIAMQKKKVVLTCWCFPKDCHASRFLEVLKCLLEEVLIDY